jgi:hypothetical protein
LAAAESGVMEKKSNMSPRGILYTTGYSMEAKYRSVGKLKRNVYHKEQCQPQTSVPQKVEPQNTMKDEEISKLPSYNHQ